MEAIKCDEYYADMYRKEAFTKCGPHHLKRVDWKSGNDRKSVVASLVKGVYILERDRQKKREGPRALATMWWTFFGFRLVETLTLVDEKDRSAFGAVFEYMGTDHMVSRSPSATQAPPRYVLAFRGTLTKFETMGRDLVLDAQIAFKRSLAEESRYRMGLETLHKLLSNDGQESTWLAGHSLGATIALKVGKTMAEKKCYVESYLFNPPFPRLPFQQINDETIMKGVQVFHSLVAAGLSRFVGKNATPSAPQDDPFLSLCPWTPHLFVHPSDVICAEYISYFEVRETLESLGLGRVNRRAIRSSIVDLISHVLGMGGEATHLIPSAHLTKNKGLGMNFFEAHSLQQWWHPQNEFHSKKHQLDHST